MSTLKHLITLLALSLVLPVACFAEEVKPKELLKDLTFSDASNWFFQDSERIELKDLSLGNGPGVRLNGTRTHEWSHVGTQVRNVPRKTDLCFSCLLRGKKPRQGLEVNAFAYDDSDKCLTNWHKVITVDDKQWKQFEAHYAAPDKADYLMVWVIDPTKEDAYVSQPSMLLAAKPEQRAAAANSNKKGEYEVPEWYGYTAKGDFEIGVDTTEKHSGSRSGYVKSVVAKPREFGNLQQAFVPNNYLGKRLEMTAWVKTKLTSGTAQLWVRVDGEWPDNYTKPGTFDNMDDRPIKGNTDWTQYSIVLDVPETGNHVAFGLMLLGTGQIWLDDVTFETVGKDVPLTGSYAQLKGCGKKEALNLNFEK